MSAAAAQLDAGRTAGVNANAVLAIVAVATVAAVLRAERAQHGRAGRARKGGSAVADPTAQLSVSSTRTIVSRLQQRFGGRMPSSRELLAVDPQELRASGMSTRKVATLRALAERFVDSQLSDESLARMTDQEVEATLTDVRGIGPWTAHRFLIVALDRPDVLLPGDLALRRAVQRAYGFDHLPTEDEMVQVPERWRPYRSLAVSYLFASEFEKGT